MKTFEEYPDGTEFSYTPVGSEWVKKGRSLVCIKPGGSWKSGEEYKSPLPQGWPNDWIPLNKKSEEFKTFYERLL